MKAAVLRGKSDVRLEEWPTPVIGPGELLLQTLACGVCGTDIHKAAHASVKIPAVLGHEVCGRVVQVGAGVTRFKEGDRIALTHHTPCFSCHYCRKGNYTMCRTWKSSNLDPGGFAEFIRVPAPQAEHNSFLVPDFLSDAAACHLEPLACIVRGLNRAPIHVGDTMLIIGAGPIGLLHLQAARANMVGTTIVADISPYRLAQAKRFGADHIINNATANLADEVRAITGGRGVDLAVIAAAVPALLSQAVDLVDRGGKVLAFAPINAESVSMNARRFFEDEISLIGSFSSGPADLEQAFHLLKTGAVRADEMTSHRFGLADVATSLTLSQQPGAEVMKIVIVPGGN